MEKKFDLTTVSGFTQAAEVLESDWGWVLFPQFKVAKALVDWLSSPSEVSPEKQAEAAERIIKAGREQGAKKITMKVDKNVGAKLKASGNIKGSTVVAEGGVGTDGKMVLEVEYK